MRVRLAGITGESAVDGPGLRITLFFQGCQHRCPGCHNSQTWDPEGGVEYELDDLFAQLEDTPLIQGVTLSGGDPFYQPQAAAAIAREFHARGKDVWTYTGFVWEALLSSANPAHLDLIRQSDVLVDGPFIFARRDPRLPYRGSDNQRLILVKASLDRGQVTLWASPSFKD